ncbi:acyl-CoA dehydrogenase [Klebsiella grimontii]|uniref:Acyl-CoA dehydrogenase n=1 Tax=Klebsiella grimontii TaxID=2058152 RepID=A0A7H4P2I2_9ENTR|nr:acyl-CoA dehydrogenase [Klebsiella grimontii]
MKKIAIIGAGPTGIIPCFHSLNAVNRWTCPFTKQAEEAGVGMPYSDEETRA